MKRYLYTLVIAAIASLLAAGCSSAGGGQPNTGVLSSHSSTTLPDGLTLQLSEDKVLIEANGTINYTVTLSNPTTALVTTELITNEQTAPFTLDPFYAVLVTASNGSRVSPTGQLGWYPPVRAPYINSVTLQPGQSVTATVGYQLVQSGVYTAVTQMVSPQSIIGGSNPYVSYDAVVANVQ